MNGGSGWKWLINPVAALYWVWVLFLMKSSKLAVIVSCRDTVMMVLCHKTSLRDTVEVSEASTSKMLKNIWNSCLPAF